jgi:hypothetical protein
MAREGFRGGVVPVVAGERREDGGRRLVGRELGSTTSGTDGARLVEVAKAVGAVGGGSAVRAAGAFG